MSPKQLVGALLPASLKLRLKCKRIDGDLHLRVPDRIDLEEKIIPHFVAEHAPSQILDIGCDWYAQWYAKLFPDADYWTMDIDPDKEQYGAGERHRTVSLTEAAGAFPEMSFDLVLCNGVFGWGLSEEGEVETALGELRALTAPGGHLIVGWNNRDPHIPAIIPDGELEGFTPYDFPEVGRRWDTGAAHRHLYDFFVREA